jgi:hypothetical protein
MENKQVEFDFQGSRWMGQVIKQNKNTVWVALQISLHPDEGLCYLTIKRHIKKHNVK